jgi:predicted nuclease of predicted toxin-antitoxin system
MKLQDIKILTDENISPKVVMSLRQSGYDVLDTKEQRWWGKEDQDLLNIAYQEQRFLLTHDSDFGTQQEMDETQLVELIRITATTRCFGHLENPKSFCPS